ncbi:MAG: four helix bundle protein [Myxococcales bacterium]|nr:four helix bundle protein [Myxococcales bacterium]
MGLIVQQKALEAAAGLQPLLPIIRKADRDLFDQVRRAMNSVVLNIAEAGGNDPGTARARFASACGSAKEVRAGLQLAAAYGYVGGNRCANLDITLDEVCAMSWRLSGR